MNIGDALQELERRAKACNGLMMQYDPDTESGREAIQRLKGKREAYRHAKDFVKDITSLDRNSTWQY